MTTAGLDRTLRLLDRFAADAGATLRFSQIRAELDCGAASLSRLLGQLVAEGVLIKDADGYRPGPRLTTWTAGLPEAPGLGARVHPLLGAIRDAHGVTAICIERRGRRAHAVAKVMHPDAPALMPVGGDFPPRLPYFGCVLFLDPERDALRRWVRSQLVDVDPRVAARVDAGVAVTRHYLETGTYRDDDQLWPGQLRLAVPIAGRRGLIGASVIAGTLDQDAEAALLADLRTAAADPAIR